MSDIQANGRFGMIVLLSVLIVMLCGGVLMWNLIQESEKEPRPQTPIRYLKSNEAKGNPPANFNDPKVDKKQLIP